VSRSPYQKRRMGAGNKKKPISGRETHKFTWWGAGREKLLKPNQGISPPRGVKVGKKSERKTGEHPTRFAGAGDGGRVFAGRMMEKKGKEFRRKSLRNLTEPQGLRGMGNQQGKGNAWKLVKNVVGKNQSYTWGAGTA